jgi:hypothetical protein
MRIGAEEHRLYWKILGVGIAVDLFGAAIVVIVFEKISGEKNDSFLLTTGIVWLTIQIFRFVIMFLNIGRLWAAKEVGAFKSSGEAFYSALRENDLPKPDGYTPSVDTYLTGIADDEEQAAKARVIAASLYGVRQGTKNLGIIHSVLLESAHEEALKRYADS